MKVLAVLSLVLAVATCYPVVKTFTLQELEKAVNDDSEPELKPYYLAALDEIVGHLFKGEDKFSQKVFLSPSGNDKWTVEELTNEIKVIEDSNSADADYMTAVYQAYGYYKQKQELGIVETEIEVTLPAMDVSKWTLQDLQTAQKDVNTKAELLPYVGKAIAEITKDSIGMVTPVGVLPHEPYF